MLRRNVEACGLDWRRNEDRLAAIVLGDPRSDTGRVGDEIIHARCCDIVPVAQPGDEGREYHAGEPAQSFTLDILLVVPGPTHRRVTVADVQRIGARDDAL